MKEPYYKTNEPPHCPTCDCCARHPDAIHHMERDAARYRWLRDTASRAAAELFLDRRGTRLAADRVCDVGIDIAREGANSKLSGAALAASKEERSDD